VGVRTLIIGESAILRGGIAFLLKTTRYKVIATAVSVSEIGALTVDNVELVIIGASAGVRTNAAISELREKLPHAAIVAVAERPDAYDADVLLQKGANACILDFTTDEVLLKTLDLALLRQRFVVIGHSGPAERHNHGESSRRPTVSAFDRQILRCLAHGASNKAIARIFSVSEATVKSRVKAILKKIGVQNRTQAAIWAKKNGILKL
jgi:two-component system nitrate/nitrite response regulator NarL